MLETTHHSAWGCQDTVSGIAVTQHIMQLGGSVGPVQTIVTPNVLAIYHLVLTLYLHLMDVTSALECIQTSMILMHPHICQHMLLKVLIVD